MKKFIIKILIFALILFGYTGLNLAINKLIISESDVPMRQVNILIAGDSHPKNSVNPAYFESARNISQTAEPYVITFWKLKYLLPKFPVDTVILGFSHHNISAFNDRKFTDKKWASEMFKRTYPIQNFDGLHHINVDFTKFYKIYFRNMMLYPNTDHFDYLGKYSNTDYSDISNTEEVIKRHYFYKGEPVGISETSISYLDSIVKICNEQNVTLILAGSPVHEDYFGQIPDYIKQRYNEEKSRLRNEGIMVIDHSDEFYKKDHFLDADHLNEKGADKFTKEIIGNIE